MIKKIEESQRTSLFVYRSLCIRRVCTWMSGIRPKLGFNNPAVHERHDRAFHQIDLVNELVIKLLKMQSYTFAKPIMGTVWVVINGYLRSKWEKHLRLTALFLLCLRASFPNPQPAEELHRRRTFAGQNGWRRAERCACWGYNGCRVTLNRKLLYTEQEALHYTQPGALNPIQHPDRLTPKVKPDFELHEPQLKCFTALVEMIKNPMDEGKSGMVCFKTKAKVWLQKNAWEEPLFVRKAVLCVSKICAKLIMNVGICCQHKCLTIRKI